MKTRACQQCGTALAGESWSGLCPRCDLESVLETPRGAFTMCDPDGAAIRYFGEYELLEKIAHGGMGVVYKARQTSLQRIVAVKMLLAGPFASPAFVQRFRVEAEAAAGLQHPNIVAIHEVGEHDGQQYFSMDYVEGRDLAALTREKPLPATKAASYVRAIAGAVHYAHEHGILHRDLKPSNVLIDSFDQPRVTDFGLAKRLSHSEPETRNPELTLSGQLLGSPGYMAPEQASGKRGGVGVRSDVYSLGAILYHVLTGRAPFCAESVEETLVQLLNHEPVPPRVLNPAVPRDLETICLKCLEKDPPRRYRTAQEVAEELERFLRNEPILARPAHALEKSWRWCRRRPAIAALVATVTLLLVAIAAGSTIAAFRIKRAELIATARLRDALVAEASARRVSARPGQRYETLDALRRASALNPPPELRYRIRNEAIAALALPDVRLVQTRPTAPTPMGAVELLRFDRSLKLYARMNARRGLSICRVADDSEVSVLSFGRRVPTWIHDFSPDGKWIALTVAGELQLWDVTNRTVGLRLPIGLTGSDFSPDGNLVSVVTTQKTVVVHALKSGERVLEIADVSATGHARFDPSGTRLALFNSRTSSAEIRDARSGTLWRALPYARSSSDFGWSEDGQTLAATGIDGNVRVWNVANGAQRFVLEGHDSRALRVSFSHDGRLIATTSWDNTIRLWDAKNGRLVLTHPGVTYQLHFSPDDRFLAFAQTGEQFGLLELAAHPEFTAFVPDERSSDSFTAAFSVDGRLLANTSKNRVHLWDAQTGRALGTIAEPFGRTVLFTPDGAALLTCGLSGLARWPIQRNETGGVLALRVGEREEILPAQALLQLAMTPDGKTFAVVNRDKGEARVFPANAPDQAIVCAPHKSIQYAALSPDGRWLATGPWYGKGVKIWDARTGRQLHELPASERTLVQFSPDGRWLVTAGEHYQIWETGTWKPGPALPVSPPNVPIGRAAFSPDGAVLAIVRGGRELQLFRMADGRAPEPLAIFATPAQARLSAPRFNGDGTALVAVGGNGEAFLWNLRAIREQLARLGVDWQGGRDTGER